MPPISHFLKNGTLISDLDFYRWPWPWYQRNVFTTRNTHVKYKYKRSITYHSIFCFLDKHQQSGKHNYAPQSIWGYGWGSGGVGVPQKHFGKRRDNSGYQHFLLIPTCFQKASNGIVWKRVQRYKFNLSAINHLHLLHMPASVSCHLWHMT